MRQQITAMHRYWPRFDVLEDSPDRTLWFGSLAGIERQHRIMVEYGLPNIPERDPMWRQFPVVRVISPQLTLRFGAKDGPLPHVYFDDDDITFSALCLFDPGAGEWSHDDLLALTTIPWAAEWLACYEAWLATGEWVGGGRHMVGSPEDPSQ